MRNFTIELMNYRCFSGNPVRWHFAGEGLTSFVGPNNAGKSTFVRLFYELRGLFSMLGDQGNLASLAQNPQGLGFTGTEDAAEIPSFGTPGPVVIDLAMDASAVGQLT